MIGIVLIMHETAVTLPFISQTEQRFDVYLTAFCVFGFEQNKKKCVLMKPRPTILINDSTNREWGLDVNERFKSMVQALEICSGFWDHCTWVKYRRDTTVSRDTVWGGVKEESQGSVTMRLSAKRSLSNGLRLFVNLIYFFHVAMFPYSLIPFECRPFAFRETVQHHRPCYTWSHIAEIQRGTSFCSFVSTRQGCYLYAEFRTVTEQPSILPPESKFWPLL